MLRCGIINEGDTILRYKRITGLLRLKYNYPSASESFAHDAFRSAHGSRERDREREIDR